MVEDTRAAAAGPRSSPRRAGRWFGMPLLACLVLSQSAPAQTPSDPGQLTLAVSGADGVFGFSSASPALNQVLAGDSQGAPVALPPGDYGVVIDDLSGLGLVVTAVSCSDDDSRGDVLGRSADIALAPGEKLTCRFVLAPSGTRAGQLIGDFIDSHDLVLGSLPTADDRADRLRGRIGVIDSPKPFMESLPGVMSGQPVPLEVSLAAIDRMAGNEQQSDFDIWLKGTYALLFERGPQGRYATTTLGIDYRVTADILVGTFGQLNAQSQAWSEGASIVALGWAAGGFATVRLADHLYVDLLGGGGTAVDTITTSGLGPSRFDASGWLLNATLFGKWELAGFTFSPRVQVNYASQATQPYIDSAGGIVAEQQHSVGEVIFGPGIAYRLTTEDRLVVETGLRLDATAELFGAMASGHYSGRVEGKIELELPTGSTFATTLNLGGLGGDSRVFTARGTLSLPLQ